MPILRADCEYTCDRCSGDIALGSGLAFCQKCDFARCLRCEALGYERLASSGGGTPSASSSASDVSVEAEFDGLGYSVRGYLVRMLQLSRSANASAASCRSHSI